MNDIVLIPRKHWEIIIKNTTCPLDFRWSGPVIRLGGYEDIADACLEDECKIAETCKWLKEFAARESKS